MFKVVVVMSRKGTNCPATKLVLAWLFIIFRGEIILLTEGSAEGNRFWDEVNRQGLLNDRPKQVGHPLVCVLKNDDLVSAIAEPDSAVLEVVLSESGVDVIPPDFSPSAKPLQLTLTESS